MPRKRQEPDKIDLILTEKLKKSRFYLKLNNQAKGRYMELLGQIYEDTEGGLSDTEYENLVTMSYVCEEFERLVLVDGFEDIDARMFSEYRKSKETILRSMQENREQRKGHGQTLDETKEVLKKIDFNSGVLEDDDKDNAPKPVVKNKGSPRKVVDTNTTENKA
jgi:hypothetical protein